MTVRKILLPAIALAVVLPAKSGAQAVPTAGAYSYADLVDLTDAAPLVVEAEIDEAIRVKDAPGVPAGFTRFYVEADVLALIRGPGGVAPRINYVVDVALDGRGKAPKLKKNRVILLARTVSGKPGSVQLVAPDAQIPWSDSASSQIRAILSELTSRNAPPRITGVANAFHTPGTIPGEGETQIFLSTPSGDPVSLSVLRRPGQQPRWAVALGEIVDEAARPPERDTMLWYRLACSLPAEMPESALEGIDPTYANVARTDYRIVKQGLGRCTRNRAVAGAQPSPVSR